MKKFVHTLLIITAAIVMISMTSCKDSKETLYIYNWSDYINGELVQQFEEENNCTVILDFFDSNESMYAKIKAGADGYDIIFPTAYMVQVMAQEGLIEEIDHSEIPNIGNIDEKYLPFSLDETMKYSVPYMLSNSGIGYLSHKVGDNFVPSWNVFGDAQFAGRMTMLNDMRETIGAALKYLGYSMNSVNPEELEKAGELVISWKKNLAKFEADLYKNGLVSEEFTVSHGYSGDVFQLVEENENIVYAIPIEGTTISCDSMVILKSAKNKELAYKFINFILTPDVAAKNMEYVYYVAPIKDAYELVDEEVRSEPAIFLSDEMLAKSEVLQDLGENNKLYSDLWDKIKSAQ